MGERKKQHLRKEIEAKLLETFNLTENGIKTKKAKKGIKKAGKILSELVVHQQLALKSGKKDKTPSTISLETV